jgi:transposase
MAKCKELTDNQKSQILALLKSNAFSQRDIAAQLQVSRGAVRNVLAKMKTDTVFFKGRCLPRLKRRVTSARDDRRIVSLLKEQKKTTLNNLRKKLADQGVVVSSRTLRRRLSASGYRGCRPAKKPRLTPAMKQKRLEWAKKHRNWTSEDWSKVCWSDESHFEILGEKSQVVYRRPWEKYDEDCISGRVKHPDKVMVWSVISGKGTGRLYPVEGMMRQDQYRHVLENRLLPQAQEWFPDSNFIFMQDSAPCHTAKSVMAYLREKRVQVLEWPGNSPDLNPIENLWDIVKRRICKGETITTTRRLKEKLIEVWARDPELKTHAQSCIASMPRRVQAVIKAKGGTTKY